MSFNLRRILNIIAVVVTITMNSLANIIPFNGLNTGVISDSFKVFFVPAGYVFSIWGIIYIGLSSFAVYQALPFNRDNQVLKAITPVFLVSCVANSVWLVLWHYLQFPLTLVFMLMLLASLITIYLRLDIGRKAVSAGWKWCVNVPFSVYLGWITVATIANVTDLLDYLKWNAFGIDGQVWAMILLAVAVIVAALMAWTRADVAYLFVLVWAFAGIGVKQAPYALVSTAAWAATAAAGVAVIIAYVVRRPALARSAA